MRRLIAVPGALALAAALLFAAPVRGQVRTEVRTAGVFERYTFDDGLTFGEVSEFTIPVTATFRFGRRADLTLSSGYARLGVTSDAGEETVLSGVLDTEARLGISLVQDRLVLLLTGAAPTGINAFTATELPALQALATDVIGFSAASLGSGGGVGGGLVAAVPVGRMGLGLAATYRMPLTYQPIVGIEDELRPGSELRLRGGLEGAVGARTYLRLTGIFLRRSKDELNGEVMNGIGNRYAGYLAIDQGIGRSTLTLYGFDLFRADPQIEQTVVGAALFPRGNVIGAGVQLAVPVTQRVQFKPRMEYRGSWQEPEIDGSSFERVGSSLRFGADLRYAPTGTFALALQADGLTGNVAGPLDDVGLKGFRVGVHLEIRP